MSHVMTALAAQTPATAYRRARAAFAAEWIKLRSLRSMLVTPLLATVVCIGLADLVCSNYVANWSRLDAARKAAFDPLNTNIQFVVIGAIFLGVLGALVVTNEYGHGLIRTTLAATPQRGLVLATKAVLLGLIAFVVSAVICFTAFFTGQALLSGGHLPHVSLSDPGVLGHVMGAVCYMTAVGLIGLFGAVLVRGSAAAAISGVFALLFVLPVLTSGIPDDIAKRDIVPYFPTNLGGALYLSHPAHDVGVTGTGVAVLATAAWVLVLGVAAVFSLRGHDA
jgi:ABC-type transport system involved in multi-copper enzyme maturation permease subunit